jgi:hypothetical protein
MMKLRPALILVALALVVLTGCTERAAQQSPEPPAREIAGTPTDTVKLTAYINVTSRCQDPTVELLKELAQQYADCVKMELVDFGTPEGKKRLDEDEVACMALLFNGSPVVRIPGEDGEKRTVTFYFPVGFGWTHDDLRQTFAAIESGEIEVLDEREARAALAPELIEMKVTVNEADGAAEVLMNGQVAFTITEDGGGRTPLQRAETAKEALEEWTSEPVHPHQLQVMDAEQGDGWSVQANGKELVHVYEGDAEAAGVTPPKKYAAEWLRGIRYGISVATRIDQKSGSEQARPTPPG